MNRNCSLSRKFFRGRRALASIAGAILLSSAAGCDSSAKTTLGPTSFVKCSVTAAATPNAFPPEGGKGQLTVAAERECSWSAKAGAPWLTMSTPESGQGNASVAFAVLPNVDPAPRSATMTVNDHEVPISQQPGVCRFRLSSTAERLPSEGGRATIDVTPTSPACEWSARSETPWITIRDGATGRGNGRVTFEAGPTSGPSRSGTIIVADQSVTVSQGDGCSFSIAPASQTVGAAGGSGTVTVTTGEGCAWSAASQTPWIAITAGASGRGPGEVRFSVSATTGPPRSGTMTIAGRSFTVTQESGCSAGIDPQSRAFDAAGGPGTVRVTIAAGCEWRATTTASWITIRSGATGTGPGEVAFDVASNLGAARSGTMAIGGRTFTVTQVGGCTYTLGSDAADVAAGGGTGSVSVSTAAGCTWTASADPAAPWVRITAGASGNGAGTVEFSVEANAGAARSAVLTIAGRSFTVRQSGACSYSVAPTSVSVPPAGGGGSVAVTTPPNCSWTAAVASGAEWITMGAGAGGTGDGSVQFTAAANTGPARAGALTVAGVTVTVDQATGCAFAIAPASQAFEAQGGPGTFSVTAGEGCTWTVTSGVEWIAIVSGASGAGNGSVAFTVAENKEAAPRSGTIAAAGQTFTVMQAAAGSGPRD